MSDAPPKAGRSLWLRRLGSGANIAMAIILATAIAIMINYLSSRHSKRFDWTRDNYYSLSPMTHGILEGLSNQVDIVMFIKADHLVFEDVDALLREYETASPMVRVTRIDPLRQAARSDDLMRKYQLKRANVVIVRSRDRIRIVTDLELANPDPVATEQGVGLRRRDFPGERLVTSAILEVTRTEKPVVYFTTGHGEKDPGSDDRIGGCSSIAQLVASGHTEPRLLDLPATRKIPADAAAVVIAGPRNAASVAEVDALRNYIDRGGRVLLLLDEVSDGGYGGLLRDWGIRLTDQIGTGEQDAQAAIPLAMREAGDHAITRSLTNSVVLMTHPRMLGMSPAPHGAATTAGWSSPVPLLAAPSGTLVARIGTMPGEHPEVLETPAAVAAAVDRGSRSGGDRSIRTTRLVVVGDSDFIANGQLGNANPEFFLRALNWLLERNEMVNIPAKRPRLMHVTLSPVELQLLFVVVVAGYPAAIGVAGLLVRLRRRK